MSITCPKLINYYMLVKSFLSSLQINILVDIKKESWMVNLKLFSHKNFQSAIQHKTIVLYTYCLKELFLKKYKKNVFFLEYAYTLVNIQQNYKIMFLPKKITNTLYVFIFKHLCFLPFFSQIPYKFAYVNIMVFNWIFYKKKTVWKLLWVFIWTHISIRYRNEIWILKYKQIRHVLPQISPTALY